MSLKGTKLYSILKMKCPSCQEGDFFEGRPYNLSKMGKVKKECPKCSLKYEREPGFFQGSYYVSYALGVALFITVGILNFLFFPNSGPTQLLLLIITFTLALAPLMYALSKIIWINLFVHYKSN